MSGVRMYRRREEKMPEVRVLESMMCGVSREREASSQKEQEEKNLEEHVHCALGEGAKEIEALSLVLEGFVDVEDLDIENGRSGKVVSLFQRSSLQDKVGDVAESGGHVSRSGEENERNESPREDRLLGQRQLEADNQSNGAYEVLVCTPADPGNDRKLSALSHRAGVIAPPLGPLKQVEVDAARLELDPLPRRNRQRCGGAVGGRWAEKVPSLQREEERKGPADQEKQDGRLGRQVVEDGGREVVKPPDSQEIVERRDGQDEELDGEEDDLPAQVEALEALDDLVVDGDQPRSSERDGDARVLELRGAVLVDDSTATLMDMDLWGIEQRLGLGSAFGGDNSLGDRDVHGCGRALVVRGHGS
ncbi:uncharacterized protein BJ171DRAFT_509710 [Polychytrium aggregatum]|uniref:uncharacterized protein n=1 Tax=Polychytrium aggregatum TaxID=110093 RepID=UPI0022FE6C67|nr:uncharacterized protein BJ171DRAFT_509710 [Polychytrium aggregatum]KAI9203467.1 hypothetical protein BJ171DRAFT_509710 [Polychytrium aggregatum]